jgi:ATP-dependent DNA helicase RecG
MIRECEAAGLPRPEFTTAMGQFIVRLRKAEEAPTYEDLTRWNERQRRALSYVREHGQITQSQYRALVHLGASQAKEDLTELVQAGLFVRKGRGRATVYQLASETGRGE